jgi:hypothetical protein
MQIVDVVRVSVFSVYLCLCVPWCLYAAWRWHKNAHLPAIKERFPALSLIGFFIYPIATISLALARIVNYYPCSILVWQDFAITYVTILVYLFRAFIYFYKYEWVHERLQYFQKTKSQSGDINMPRASTFFHRHRFLMKKDVLVRVFVGIVSIEAVVPLGYCILKRNDMRNQSPGSNCDSQGWGVFVYVGLGMHLMLMFVLAFKIRPARDLYNVRSDLKLGLYTVLGVYILYVAAMFSGQFGISQKFPVSSLISCSCCVILSYIGAWRPVQLVLAPEPPKEDSENPEFSSLSSVTLTKGFSGSTGGGKASLFNSKKCQILCQFLSDQVCRVEFQAYVMSAYAIENLLFFDAAIEYHIKWSDLNVNSNIDSQDVRKEIIKHALQIYKEYLHKHAVLTVNVSHQCKLRFSEQFNAALALDNSGNYTYDAVKFPLEELPQIFDKSFGEVLGMLHDDLFLKFRNTPQYASCSAGILTQFPVVIEDKAE